KNTEVHINFTGADTKVGVVGPTPVELLSQNYNSVFTSPQTTENQLAMLSINGTTKLSDTWSGSAVTYLRTFHQRHGDGNISDVAPCTGFNADGTKNNNDTGKLCLQTSSGAEQYALDQHHNTITTADLYKPGDTIGEIDRSSNDTNSYGLSL